MSRTPPAAISAKSASTSPCSRIGAPARTLTPPGRNVAYVRAIAMASALSPTMSFGRPGTCGSPAEIIVVTPPWRDDSMKSSVRWRGVKSPTTGWACESMRPGMTVVPLASMTTVGVAAIAHAVADRIDPAVDDRDRVAIDERRVDVARDDPADAGDQRPHRGRLSAGRPRRRRPQRQDRRSARCGRPAFVTARASSSSSAPGASGTRDRDRVEMRADRASP